MLGLGILSKKREMKLAQLKLNEIFDGAYMKKRIHVIAPLNSCFFLMEKAQVFGVHMEDK